ncbi:MAG: TonB family protein [Methylococcales bacterium]|nr:TonB family protein [Methylococcales bacterium]
MRGVTKDMTTGSASSALLQERPERMLILLAILVILLHAAIWLLFFRQPQPQTVSQATPFKLEVSLLSKGDTATDKPIPASKPAQNPSPDKTQAKKPNKQTEKSPEKSPPAKQQQMELAELQRIIESQPNPKVSREVKTVPGTRTTQTVASAVFPGHPKTPNARDNFPESDEHNPSPEYPEMALFLGYQGTTIVRVHVSGKGLNKGVEIVRGSSHKILDEAVANTLKKWRFSATNHDDSVIILVNFIINH